MSILTLLLIAAYFTPVTLIAFGVSFIVARGVAPNLIWGWKRVIGALALSMGLTPVPAVLWSALSGARPDSANMFIVGFTSAAIGIVLVGLFCDRKNEPTTALAPAKTPSPQVGGQSQPSAEVSALVRQCDKCGVKVSQEDRYCKGCGVGLQN